MNEHTSNPIIEMSGVSKWFGEFQVLKEVDLQVFSGERVVVCGPSGSGKSTLIRCINRLEEHQEGRIVVDGIELDQDTQHIAFGTNNSRSLSSVGDCLSISLRTL